MFLNIILLLSLLLLQELFIVIECMLEHEVSVIAVIRAPELLSGRVHPRMHWLTRKGTHLLHLKDVVKTH